MLVTRWSCPFWRFRPSYWKRFSVEIQSAIQKIVRFPPRSLEMVNLFLNRIIWRQFVIIRILNLVKDVTPVPHVNNIAFTTTFIVKLICRKLYDCLIIICDGAKMSSCPSWPTNKKIWDDLLGLWYFSPEISDKRCPPFRNQPLSMNVIHNYPSATWVLETSTWRLATVEFMSVLRLDEYLSRNFCQFTKSMEKHQNKLFPPFLKTIYTRWITKLVIQALTNKGVDSLNFIVKNKIAEDLYSYKSVDSVTSGNEATRRNWCVRNSAA